MTQYPEQPDWLRKLIYGLADFRKIRVLIDGKRFAVVQCPGGRWSDNGGSHYGCAMYHLVDKELPDLRCGVGLIETPVLQEGGRAKLAQWRKLVEASDNAGKPITEIKDETVAEGQ